MATLPVGFLNNPRAFMGFVGFVRIHVGGSQYIIRATSADINVTQEITKPDVIDSRYDKSVYQLGPQLVDGSISFPVIYEVVSGTTLFEQLYILSVERDTNGKLTEFDIDVKYDSATAEFTYRRCVVNTWKFSVAQSDVITCDFDIIGIDRIPATVGSPARADAVCTPIGNTANGSLGTTRIVTWNDARVELSGGRFASSIGGQYVRTFEANIANDVERFYALNTVLAPQDLAPRKRDVTGSMTLIGRHPDLADVAIKNEDNCTESGEVKFGYATPASGEGCSATTFNVTLPNCIFEIETMSLTNDIFESTVNYHSLPAAGTGSCDPLMDIGTTAFDYVP